MEVRFLVGLVLLAAGCGAELTSPSGTGGPPDAKLPSQLPDAAVDADPPPVDARPCMGGSAHVTSGATCFVLQPGPKTRDQAEADCVAMGGHLAKVTSAADNAAIETLVAATASAFLGGTDQVTEGTFLWADGTPVTYTNWRSGEPNNGAGQYEEDCIVIQGTLAGVWDDRPCAPPPLNSGSYAYVCSY